MLQFIGKEPETDEEAVKEFGFQEMKLRSIEARIEAGNDASAAVLKSTGFVQDGYLKEELCFRKNFTAAHLFKTEYSFSSE